MTQADFDAAWNTFDPKEVVSYIPYDTVTDANINGQTVANIDALVEGITKEEDFFGGRIIGGGVGVARITRVFNLRAAHLPGVTVTKRGIIVEANGTAWVIGEGSADIQLLTVGTRWKCKTYKKDF